MTSQPRFCNDANVCREVVELRAERDRYREALEQIATWAEYGYQDLNSGGVLSCVKKRAKAAVWVGLKNPETEALKRLVGSPTIHALTGDDCDAKREAVEVIPAEALEDVVERANRCMDALALLRGHVEMFSEGWQIINSALALPEKNKQSPQ